MTDEKDIERRRAALAGVPAEAAGGVPEGDVSGAPDDQVLVQKLLAGDEAAVTGLVEQYHGALLRLARVFVPSQAVAEEVVQESWVGVIHGLPKFEGRSSLKTWIFRILTNRARTRGAREGRSVPFSALGNPDD